MGGWKYIHAPTPELYNVVDDPGEVVNVASQHPEVMADLREQLRGLIADSSLAVPDGRSATILDAETEGRLASLGYLGGSTVGEVGDELAGFDELKGPDPKDRIDLRLRFVMAKAYDIEGRLPEAIATLEKLIQEEPDNPAPAGYLARIRRREGKLEEVVALYGKVLALRPDDWATRLERGRVLGTLGLVNEAVDELQQAAELAPDCAGAHSYLALGLIKQGKLQEAELRFRRALTLNPAHDDACVGLSSVLAARGRAGEASEVLREGLRHAPESIRLANNLAWRLATASQASLRDGAEAVRLAEGMCERQEGEDPALLDTLAAAYAEAGRFTEAVNTARRALELAESRERSELAEQIRARLVLYESGQAYHEGS